MYSCDCVACLLLSVTNAGLAGANNVLLTQPLDTYVTRIQTGRCKHALQKEKKDEEILKPDEKKEASASHSYYDGLGASLILCVNPGIQYAIFEQLKRAALRGGRSRSLGAASAFVLGALSKSLATLATYPLIRAKVVQQVQRSQAPSDSTAANRESPSIWAVLRNIYVAEGAIGLYRYAYTLLCESHIYIYICVCVCVCVCVCMFRTSMTCCVFANIEK